MAVKGNFGACCLDVRTLTFCQLMGFPTKPLKIKLLAEQKATENTKTHHFCGSNRAATLKTAPGQVYGDRCRALRAMKPVTAAEPDAEAALAMAYGAVCAKEALHPVSMWPLDAKEDPKRGDTGKTGKTGEKKMVRTRGGAQQESPSGVFSVLLLVFRPSRFLLFFFGVGDVPQRQLCYTVNLTLFLVGFSTFVSVAGFPTSTQHQGGP